MRINFELNTENENPSMLQATAAYLNNLANINAGTALETDRLDSCKGSAN